MEMPKASWLERMNGNEKRVVVFAFQCRVLVFKAIVNLVIEVEN